LIICERGETYADVARATGYKPTVLRNVLNGRYASWPSLRRRLAEYLDLPESKLFLDGEATVR
jgi:hypothetical protein